MKISKRSPREKNRYYKRGKPNDPAKDDRPISKVYPVIDTDLARDNLENDITAADLQDL